MHHRRTLSLFWLALYVVAMLLVPFHAIHAYLDPGTGSMLAQILIGGLLSSVFLVKLFWHRIHRALHVQRLPKDTDGQPQHKW